MMIVLLGPPGSGKGTHAAAIHEACGVPHISTGAMLREAIGAGTDVGVRARAIVEQGRLVDDDTMAEIVEQRLAARDAMEGFILDGYPRNVPQARTLDRILAGRDRGVDRVLNMKVDDAEIVRRLSGRRTCGACGAIYNVSGAPPETEGVCDACGGRLEQRSDDRPDVIERRLAVYRSETEPVVAYYRERDVLRDIDAVGPVADVRRRVLEVLS